MQCVQTWAANLKTYDSSAEGGRDLFQATYLVILFSVQLYGNLEILNSERCKKNANVADLEKCCKVTLQLQISASIER